MFSIPGFFSFDLHFVQQGDRENKETVEKGERGMVMRTHTKNKNPMYIESCLTPLFLSRN